jgi:hypothetical protein
LGRMLLGAYWVCWGKGRAIGGVVSVTAVVGKADSVAEVVVSVGMGVAVSISEVGVGMV